MLGSQGIYLNRQSDSPKNKAQLTLSQGMLKKGDVADKDDEVRTTVKPQIRVAAK